MAQPDSKGWVKTCPNCRGKVEELARTCVHCGYDWDHPVITTPRPRHPLGLLCMIYVLAMGVGVPVTMGGGLLNSAGNAAVAIVVAPFHSALATAALATPVVFVLAWVGLFKSDRAIDKAFCALALVVGVGVAVVAMFFVQGIGALH